MNNLIDQYRSWILDIPDNTGDIIACVVYIVFCVAMTGAAVTFSSGAHMPMALWLGLLFAIMLLVYIP